MSADPTRSVLWGIVIACALWAGAEARHIAWRSGAGAATASVPAVEAALVEQSFAPIQRALRDGNQEEALLALRERTQRGPHPGYAWFWLGQMAYGEGAYEASVQHYRRAVDHNPVLADRGGAFRAAEIMDRNLSALLDGPWRERRPREVRDLYYLRRRLGGGCE